MHFYKYFLFLSIVFYFSSCKVFRSNLMLKTPKDYTYDKIVDSISKQDYKIEANDIINIRMFANDGFKLVDLANSGLTNNLIQLDYLVNSYLLKNNKK